MSESKIEFENLKTNIITKYQGSLDLERVKDYFSCVINSKRSLSRVTDLSDIFHLLEERDVLDFNNVSALVCLENLIRNEDVFNLIQGYKKLYLDSDYSVCHCGEDLSFSFPIVNLERNNTLDNQSHSLDSAFKNIALQIGENWRVLVSELDVPERYVDEVRKKYPFDFYQQTWKILNIWKEINEETATMDVLTEALGARLCRRKGVGIHMLKPVITVE